MFKFNRTNRNAITTIVVILAIILVLSATKSAYSPRPITIKAKTAAKPVSFAFLS